MKDGDVSPAPEALTEEDITRFFNVKLHDLKCPACGGENFAIEFSDSLKFVTWPAENSFGPLPGGRAAVIPMSCDNCAYILPFSYLMIAKWVAQQKAGVPNDKV